MPVYGRITYTYAWQTRHCVHFPNFQLLIQINNIPTFAYEGRWTMENSSNATWPKALTGYEREWKISNRYVEDGSYLKLKTVNLGYNWKPKFKGVKNINIYATAANLFTITGYSWFDPEVNAFGTDTSRRGVDCYSYPSSRTYSLGVKITL